MTVLRRHNLHDLHVLAYNLTKLPSFTFPCAARAVGYTANYPRSVSGGFGTIGVQPARPRPWDRRAGRPRSWNGSRFPRRILTKRNVWLRGHFPHTPDEYDAYESAAKEDAANGLNKVWECYVAGLNPTNATDVFRAVISIGADGEPVVGWEPDLNEGGTKHERVYTVEGKENLTDSWAPTNSASRFFRVKVSMP